jgi:transaldolase
MPIIANRLQALTHAGVSVWLDDLSRELLDSGRFAELIADFSVTGATSNPTIFARAIKGSKSYDPQLRAALAAGVQSPRDLFVELALDDVRRAADLLLPVYEASGGRDGFASFECTPDLADDTHGTVEQAMELWRRLGRRNTMIKVPATEAGIPAIEELTARGVNVNVTLLFSIARYEQTTDAPQPGRPSTASPRSPPSSSRAWTRRSTRDCPPAQVSAAASRSRTPFWRTPATSTASAKTAASPTTAGGH